MSLFESLTNTTIPESTEENASTQLIRNLLKVGALDACRAKRNTFSAFSLLSTARDLCKQIHTLAQEVDDSDDLDDWTAYEKYTKAIAPLQQYARFRASLQQTLLFKIVDWVAQESGQFLNNTRSIQEAVECIGIWEKARTDLLKLKAVEAAETHLQAIKSASPSSDADLQTHDDRCLISALCKEISTNTTFHGPKLSSMAHGNSRERKLSPLPALLAMQLKTEAVKCAMIVQGAVYLTDNATEPNTKTLLRVNRKIWEKAVALFKDLSTHLTTDTPKLRAIQTAYDEFVEFLNFKLDVEIPTEYLDIRRAVRRVKGPYHARTLALEAQCRKLVAHFSKTKQPSDLSALEDALEAAVAALDAAAQAMNTVSLIGFADADIEGTAAATAFTTAQGKVETCFKSYKLGDWTKEAAYMTTALAQDKMLALQMKESFGKNSTRTRLLCKSRSQLTRLPYLANTTHKLATLNSVVWRAIFEEGADTINEWHLEQGTPRQRVDFHEQASDFEAGGPLFLVRTPGGAPAIHGPPGGAPSGSPTRPPAKKAPRAKKPVVPGGYGAMD
ncbi:hypothetical protein FIBSPDRAFT_924368 [Athelia psychrophila]|uniref:Uncharacterized protein n=1 Tax=Athelia psychrophila TaxID=1759441 RepID=A0A166WS81_9AGAM|nr:hypothetical protein FIBSPDRAFT_924368 [Fibularhizoctonia sp. CBS 109695]